VAPRIEILQPIKGTTKGGELVRIIGTGFGPKVRVVFGEITAQVVAFRGNAGINVIDVRTPPHPAGEVDLSVQSVDLDERPIAGEIARRRRAFTYLAAPNVHEASLTRVVRTLLRLLKRDILTNTSISVSVDFGQPLEAGGVEVLAFATLPALTLSGPRVLPSRDHQTNVRHEELVLTPQGPEIRLRSPAYVADLEFSLTGASKSTAQLLNMMAGVVTFFNRATRLEIFRDPDVPDAGLVQYEMVLSGDLTTALDGPGDLRAFGCRFVVRGVEIDSGATKDLAQLLDDPADLGLDPLPDEPPP